MQAAASSFSSMAAAAAAAVAAVVLVRWAVVAWRRRHIPGPFAWPVVGSLPAMLRLGTHEFLLRQHQRYGSVFQIWLGPTPVLVLADATLARRSARVHIDRAVGRPLALTKRDAEVQRSGLVVARGSDPSGLWRTLRLAWQPAFSSESLAGYGPLMERAAEQLARRLAALCGGGGGGGKGEGGAEGDGDGKGDGYVELRAELGRMTLSVVGTTAFGVDFHASAASGGAAGKASEEEGEEDEGARLQRAVTTLLHTSSIEAGSRYLLLAALSPKWAMPAVAALAHALPDAPLRRLLAARGTISDVAGRLVREFRAAHGAGGGHDDNSTEPATSAAAAAVDDDDTAPLLDAAPKAAAAAAPAGGISDKKAAAAAAGAGPGDGVDGGGAVGSGGGARGVRGVAPGSFLGLLLRDRAGAALLPDGVVIAQANTFVVAGLETTATTLAFAVHSLCASPSAERRLLDEVDAALAAAAGAGPGALAAAAHAGRLPFAEAVIKETLRLYPPAPVLSREVSARAAPYEAAPGVVLPAGAAVWSFVFAVQRDPRCWPRAGEFLPQRWLEGDGAEALGPSTPDAWMAFGAGARMCVGWRFAMQEAVVALAKLYAHQRFELAPGQVPMRLTQRITLVPRDGVRVRVVPRAAAAAAAAAAATAAA